MISVFLRILVIAIGFSFLSCQEQKVDSQVSKEATTEQSTIPPKLVSDDQAGTLSGRVIYDGEAPKPQKLLVVKDVAVCGKQTHFDESLMVGRQNGIQNAVVYLSGTVDGQPQAPPGTQFILDQQGCRYQPHVLLLPVDTTLQILNSDNILHNIHTFSTINPPVNLAQPGFKKKLEMAFRAPEKISVKCDVHGWMSAWIVVVEHSYYALTDADGRFTLSHIPPGTYTVTCWQERLGEQTAQVTITAGETAARDFHYPNKKS
jgi:hypothetical protein